MTKQIISTFWVLIVFYKKTSQHTINHTKSDTKHISVYQIVSLHIRNLSVKLVGFPKPTFYFFTVIQSKDKIQHLDKHRSWVAYNPTVRKKYVLKIKESVTRQVVNFKCCACLHWTRICLHFYGVHLFWNFYNKKKERMCYLY